MDASDSSPRRGDRTDGRTDLLEDELYQFRQARRDLLADTAMHAAEVPLDEAPEKLRRLAIRAEMAAEVLELYIEEEGE